MIAAYGLVLLAMALVIPLQVPELISIGWLRNFSWNGFWTWTSQAPDPSPLGYLVQLPFVLALGATRLGPRLPGLLFAVASCFLFLRLAHRAVQKYRYWALLLFVLLPVQFFALTARAQYEVALFFLLLATLTFFNLSSNPGYRTAAWFTAALVACLFSDRHAGLAVFGLVLFVLRWADRPQERRALWFSLASCVVAALLYLPYYLWVHARVNEHWLVEPGFSITPLPESSPLEWLSLAGLFLLICGVIAGFVATFRLPLGQFTRRLTLFCLSGSVTLVSLLALSVAWLNRVPIPTRELLFALPGAVILFVAGLDWLHQTWRVGFPRKAAAAVGAAVALIAVAVDLSVVLGPKQDLALESRYIEPQLTSNACVVFVTEYYSKALFLLFQPQLEHRECMEFFHKRLVLASHPYVSADQRAAAERYFRGLDFVPVNRIWSGGGEIEVMETK